MQALIDWIRSHRRHVVVIGVVIVVGVVIWRIVGSLRTITDPRSRTFIQFFSGSEEEREALVTVRDQEPCTGAPFILPADGFIGLLYGDPRGPYSTGNPHQGIDIFAEEPGVVPVYAAYDGYLTREPTWRSAAIIRVPDDPLNPGRQIWLYYTHMADITGEESYVQFPAGTREQFVERGTLIGYIGNYNGGSSRRVSPHLHFSIVLDTGAGSYRNELEFDNTVDPSRYLGMAVNYGCAPLVPACTPDPLCGDAIQGYGGG